MHGYGELVAGIELQVYDDAVTIAIARPPQRRREPPLIPTYSYPCTRFPDYPDDVFTVISRRPPRREPPLRNNMTLPYLRSPPESPCTSHHDNIVIVIRSHPALTVIVRLARRHRLLPLLHLLRFSLRFSFPSSRLMETTMTRMLPCCCRCHICSSPLSPSPSLFLASALVSPDNDDDEVPQASAR